MLLARGDDGAHVENVGDPPMDGNTASSSNIETGPFVEHHVLHGERLRGPRFVSRSPGSRGAARARLINHYLS